MEEVTLWKQRIKWRKCEPP